MTEPQHDAACGKPQAGPGRPHRGWVRVNIAGKPATWYCSIPCALAGLATSAHSDAPLGPGRLDIAACPACATRHDLGHVCRSCGHIPTISGYRWRAGRTA